MKIRPVFVVAAGVLFASITLLPAQEIVVKEKVETPSTVVGNVASVDPGTSTIVLSAEGTSGPVKYVFTDETEFVDASGQALTHEALREGESASLQYFRSGDKMVVLKAVMAPPIASETTTVTRSAPVVSEKMAVESTVVKEPVTKKKVTKKTTPKKQSAPSEKKKTVTKAKKPTVVEEEKKSTTTTTTERR